MATMYSQGFMKKREMMITLSIIIGMLASLIFLFIGKLVGDEFFTDLGRVVASVALVLLLANLWLAYRAKFCGGNVLEVKNGKVLGYLKDAFYYDPRTLAGSVFVPFRQDDVVVEKTLHLPVSGRIFSCALRCEGRVVNFQRYHDKFISVNKDERPDLQQAIRACMATFFQSQRDRIAALGVQAALVEEDGAIAAQLIQQDAEKYLRSELGSCGFAIYSITPICTVKPLIIA